MKLDRPRHLPATFNVLERTAVKRLSKHPAAVLRVKHCLQMPVYPATLQHIPAPIQESVILTFGRQLKTSLQNVHQKGYGHNDVKAANIFISATGHLDLTDYPTTAKCHDAIATLQNTELTSFMSELLQPQALQ
ncbi:hypothetical protein WJX79_005652 [Trebouxia sp. C0005]